MLLAFFVVVRAILKYQGKGGIQPEQDITKVVCIEGRYSNLIGCQLKFVGFNKLSVSMLVMASRLAFSSLVTYFPG